MSLAGTSPRVTADPSKELEVVVWLVPWLVPPPSEGWGTVRAGGRRGRGPRMSGRSGRIRRRGPRRASRRIGPNQGEPLGMEGLVLSTHAGHQLVNPGDPFSDSGSVPEAAHVPATVLGGPRVRGLPGAQSPKAVLSRLTRPHRGSRERPEVPVRRSGGQRGPPRITRFHAQSEADSVGSPPGRSVTPRRGRSRGGSSSFIILRQ